MQIQEIKELMEKMSQTGINVLEFEADGNRLHLERNTPAGAFHEDGYPGLDRCRVGTRRCPAGRSGRLV
jgi:hypothetical protein